MTVSQGPAESFIYSEGRCSWAPRFLTPLPKSSPAPLLLSQPPERSFCIQHLLPYKPREVFCFFFFNMYFAAPGLSLAVACGIQFPDQGSNLGPMHWESRALATEPPGKSLGRILFLFCLLWF